MTPCLSHTFPPMYLKRNTTTRLLTLRTLLCMQLLTYETVFEYIVWPIRRTVRRVHCKKTQLYTTFWLIGSCPCANIHIQGRVFIKLAHIMSYVCARPTCFHAVCRLRDVSCACWRTNRRVSAHFLSYEVISMRNVKHMTPCWSPNFP